MLNRQFVQFKPVLDNKDTEQTAVPTGMPSVDTHRTQVSPSSQETLLLPVPPQLGSRKTGGLLSGWKPERAQEPRSAIANAALAQSTDARRQEPSSGAGINSGNLPGFVPNQVSPHELGMARSPFSASYHTSATLLMPQLSVATPPQPFATPANRPAFPGQSFAAPSGGPATAVSPMPPQTPPQPYTGPLGQPMAPGQSYALPMQPAMAPGQSYAPPMRPPVSQQLNNSPMWQAAVAPSQYQNNQPPVQSATKRKRKKQAFPTWARVVVATLLFFFLVLGSGAWYYQTNVGTAVSHITGQDFTKYDTTNTGNKKITTNAPDNSNVANSTDILGGKRVNILLLGSDNDTKFKGTMLAQTDIILTIDPKNNYVGMLSIPRDLQVTIPGLNIRDKLDTAFSYGFQSNRTTNPYADAAGLSIATIQENFGIPIDHYAWVGLNGFVKVIDTVGGVDVNALHPMVDDNYPDDATGSKNDYGYRRLYIAAGPQHMDGPHALMYVRTRHSDLVGDFGRSTRQQQVLSVLKTKLQGSNTVSQLSQLLNDLDGYVRTDMQLSDLVRMVNYAHNVDLNTVDRKVMNQPYSVSIPGTSNFAPVCSLVKPLLTKMFGLTADQARCIPQLANTGDTGNTALASLSTSAKVALPPPPTSDALRSLQQMTQVGTMSLSQGSGDVLGFNSILALVFMVACESFDAAKV